MSSGVCKLSVVCPAYEEEEVLPRFHPVLMAVLDGLGAEYEIEVLYVDDGSRDDTLGVLRHMAAIESSHRVRLEQRMRDEEALLVGIGRANLLLTLVNRAGLPVEKVGDDGTKVFSEV